MTESELTSSTMKRSEESEDDASSAGLESLRESERIIAFTDAVVAVAITLLILPLMEFATGEAKNGKEFFRRKTGLMSSFVTSFVIISLCWGGHDKIFSHVRRLTPLVTLLNFGFMICVVWMPVATSLLDFRDRAPYICYAVTLFTTRLLLAITSARVNLSRHRRDVAHRQSCSQSSGAIHGCGRNRHDRRHVSSVARPR
jgi:uncharacterized membrane protein